MMLASFAITCCRIGSRLNMWYASFRAANVKREINILRIVASSKRTKKTYQRRRGFECSVWLLRERSLLILIVMLPIVYKPTKMNNIILTVLLASSAMTNILHYKPISCRSTTKPYKSGARPKTLLQGGLYWRWWIRQKMKKKPVIHHLLFRTLWKKVHFQYLKLGWFFPHLSDVGQYFRRVWKEAERRVTTSM